MCANGMGIVWENAPFEIPKCVFCVTSMFGLKYS